MSEFAANKDLQKEAKKELMNERKPISFEAPKLGDINNPKTWSLI